MSSSSYFSDSNPQWIYDVFINFRGEDTRRNFVSHLYSALSNAGVNTFLDEMNYPKGEELNEGLLRTIEGCRICVVVFSTNYPASSWCLKELEKIIECHKTYGHIVLPIFYDVDPSDIRHQQGAFGKNLKAFQGLWGESVLSRWSTVLTQAANFSGWDVSNNRYIVQYVTLSCFFYLTEQSKFKFRIK